MALPLALTGQPKEWIELFDGHSLKGWQPSENKSSWKVVDGMLAADGPRSHLLFTRDQRKEQAFVTLSSKSIDYKARMQFRHLFPHGIPGNGLSRKGLRDPDQQYCSWRWRLS